MFNKVQLVGRVVDAGKFLEDGDKKTLFLTVAVSRDYKNSNGEFDTDFFEVVAFGQNIFSSSQEINIFMINIY